MSRRLRGTCVPAPAVVAGIGELADELVSAGQTLFVHPGPVPPPPAGAPAWWSALVDYPAQMQAAYAAWLTQGNPELPVVFAFLAGGAPFQLERLRARGGEDPEMAVYFDTAATGRSRCGSPARPADRAASSSEATPRSWTPTPLQPPSRRPEWPTQRSA